MIARQRITCHKKAGDFFKNNLDVEFYFIDWESVDKNNKWHSRANELKIYLIALEIFKDKRETKLPLWFLKYQIAKTNAIYFSKFLLVFGLKALFIFLIQMISEINKIK